jgi:two-component sensor histidine kinase/HAMP domain-containing protein
VSLLSQIKNAIVIFQRRISWKLTLWVWLLIMATIIFFVSFTIPFQQDTVLSRMDNEAEDIATSILHANSTSLITEEYGLVVDHCINIVKESKSILYLKLVKTNGFTLFFTSDRWEQKFDSVQAFDNSIQEGKIEYSELIGKNVYKKYVPYDYSGLYWGRIEVGLSLDYYYESRKEIIHRLTWLAVAMAIVGFISSSYFAKRLTGPIISLDKTTKELSDGNLNAKTNIKTGDELESLAVSFNKMTDSLRAAKENLEAKVKERTYQLEITNQALSSEITERKKAEISLHNSIKEKDVLLKEIHHRVKNNLQIITSLLNLQTRYIKDEENIAIFRDSQNRIKSMALVHEKLYQSQNFSQIDLREYIINLSSYIRETYSGINSKIKMEYDLENLILPLDTVVPLGLILSELISNAYKDPFSNSSSTQEKIIKISTSHNKDGQDKIIVEDNGVGLPKDFKIEDTPSLGLKLVNNLCMQIEADLFVDVNKGTKFTIAINNN